MFEDKKNIPVKWRSKFKQKPIQGKFYFIYYEEVFFLAIIAWILGFLFSTLLLWQLNLSFFPRPPSPNFVCQCRTEDVPNGTLKVYQSRLNKRAIVALDSSLFNPYFNARQNWGDGRSAA